MIFNWLPQMPFTDNHQLDLDWLISKYKQLEDDEATIQESLEGAEAAKEDAEAAATDAANSATAAAGSATAAAGSAEDAADTADSISDSLNQIAVNTSRIDNLVANAGDTDGNAELLDIRVSNNGVTYSTAGDAVRNADDMLYISDDVHAHNSRFALNSSYKVGAIFGNGSTYVDTVKYRVSTPNPVYTKRALHLSAAAGFKFAYATNRTGSWVDNGWKTAYTIPANTEFRISIARTVEDTSEIITDMTEFIESVTIDTSDDNRLTALEQNAVYTVLNDIYFHHYTAWERERVMDPITVNAGDTIKVTVYYDAAPTSTGYLFLKQADGTQVVAISAVNGADQKVDVYITPTTTVTGGYLELQLGMADAGGRCIISNCNWPDVIGRAGNAQMIDRTRFWGRQILAHAGGYSGVYPTNTIENAIYNVQNHGFNNIEVDVKWTSDNNGVVSHGDTVTYEGQTYNIADITYNEAITYGLKSYLPYIKAAHRYNFSLYIDTPVTSKQIAQKLAGDIKYYGAYHNIWVITNAANWKHLITLLDISPAVNVGLIYFTKPDLNDAGANAVRAVSKSGVLVDIEIYGSVPGETTGIQLTDVDYMYSWKTKGFTLGVFTIYGLTQETLDTITNWLVNADIVATEHPDAMSCL